MQEKIYSGDVRIGSSADPYEPPTKPAPFKPAEGFAAEVNIPAPENQTVEYTEQKIPERLKSAGADTDNSLSMGKSSDLGIFDSEPIQHTPEEYEEIVAYADERNVKIYDVKSFDGDMEMLKEQIDAISAVKDEFGITEKTTISFSSRIGEDLAITTKRGKAITFNKKALRNRELTDAYLASDNFFATNKSRGIALHEMGHVISYRLGEKGLDIARKTYYNIYGEEISSQEMLIWLRDNISIYSAHVSDDIAPRDFKPKNAKEVTPELLSLDRTIPNEFTNEFMRLLKEAYNL